MTEHSKFNWTVNTDAFDAVLAGLNEIHGSSSDDEKDGKKAKKEKKKKKAKKERQAKEAAEEVRGRGRGRTGVSRYSASFLKQPHPPLAVPAATGNQAIAWAGPPKLPTGPVGGQGVAGGV